jgi:hypothetical protein
MIALVEAKSFIVAVPMIPLVDERLVKMVEERQTAVIPPSYIRSGTECPPAATRMATRRTAKSTDGSSMK